MAAPHLLPIAGFTALMIVAAVEDFRRLVIPNAIVVALAVLWLAHIAGARGTTATAAGQAVAGAVLVLAGGAYLFARGLIGGGDAKLLTVASLWAGAEGLPPLLLLTALIGGVLSLALLSPPGRRLGARWQAPPAAEGRPPRVTGGTPIPYGIAIAAAALIVTLPPQFG